VPLVDGCRGGTKVRRPGRSEPLSRRWLKWGSPDEVGEGSGEVVRIVGHAVRWRLLTELVDSDYRDRGLVTRVGQRRT
jgi:hypothetical protein